MKLLIFANLVTLLLLYAMFCRIEQLRTERDALREIVERYEATMAPIWDPTEE